MLCKQRKDAQVARLKQTYKTIIQRNLPGITLETWLAMPPDKRHVVYQRAYYRANHEKAREYQRAYNQSHKKPKQPRSRPYERERIRRHWHMHNIGTLPLKQFVQVVQGVISGEYSLRK